MKNIKRFVSFALIIVLLLSVQVFAEGSATWSSYYFRSYDAYLYRTSSTTFEVWFDVTATRGMDELGTSIIKVQKSSDGTNWSTVKTYTKEMYPQMICKNTSAHADCVTYTMDTGFYYRAYVEFYAKNGTGTGYLNYYTDKI